MAEKMTCPGCTSHTSAVLMAVREGEPCPTCGLSAAAIVEVNSLRRQREDDALTERLTEALLRADRAEARVRDLEYGLRRIQHSVKDAFPDA